MWEEGSSVGRSDFSKETGNLYFYVKKKNLTFICLATSFFSLPLPGPPLRLSLPLSDIQEANPVQAKQNKSMVPI
jgi:hypothetical protein